MNLCDGDAHCRQSPAYAPPAETHAPLAAVFFIGTYRNKSYFVTVRDLRKEAHTVKKRKVTVRDSKTWSCIASQNGRFPFKE